MYWIAEEKSHTELDWADQAKVFYHGFLGVSCDIPIHLFYFFINLYYQIYLRFHKYQQKSAKSYYEESVVFSFKSIHSANNHCNHAKIYFSTN